MRHPLGHIRASQRIGLKRSIGFGQTRLVENLRQGGEIHLRAGGMQIACALRQFGHLANAAADGQPRHRMAPQIFHQPASKISHIQHRGVGQAMQRLHRALRGGPSAAGHMRRPASARHINAAVNGGDPGRARKWAHDPRRAQHRQTIDNAQPWVPGFQGQSPAPWDANGDVDIGRLTIMDRQLLHLSLHHLSRHRIDRGLAHSDWQPCLCDRADAVARMKAHTAQGARHPRND